MAQQPLLNTCCLAMSTMLVTCPAPAVRAQQKDPPIQVQYTLPEPADSHITAFKNGFISRESSGGLLSLFRPERREEKLRSAVKEFTHATAAPPRRGQLIRVRLYGMRFEPYAPHSNLSLAYVDLKNCETARQVFDFAQTYDPPREQESARRAVQGCK